MSLKRFAMLAATSYQNQQGYNNNNNNNTNNKNDNITNNDTQTTFLITTTTEATTKIINSNKSTLIQLKQQQQQQQQLQSQQVNATTFLGTTTTTTATSKSPLIPLFSNKTSSTSNQLKHDHHNDGVGSDNRNRDIIDYSSSSYSSESSESLDSGQQTTSDRHPANTYTSTTYYGSGFGVFHQQNMRSNGGGGIALITGSSSSNGLGGGSYSNGINNNVNLLLGGAMLTLITTILCVVCYCCHRNIKKRTEAAYRQQHQWLENDPNMEIYSVEQCYETSGLFVGDSMDGLATIPALHHEPPPSYDAVVAMQEQQQLLMQQHQQQLLMQQQLLQQQLATNNSPPPGYRSSLDVSRGSGLGGVLTVGGSIISGMEINSLASSTANLGTASSISPIDPLLNYNDVNGNVASSAVTVTSVTPTNSRTTASYMRNKQQHLQQQQQQQRQRNVPTNQLSQLNMKKVLQAQSCCSLQRAEVENMWNAAAAALAARTAHLPSDSRASTTASTSSPTLATNARKQSQGPETFGTRYLKQNYYRRGCPLCGKFRYDHDSTLSLSLESNLDALAGALAEENVAAEQDTDQQTTQSNLNDHETNTSDYKAKGYEEAEGHDDNEVDEEDDELDDNENEIEQQCSCLNSKQKRELSFNTQNSYERINTQNKIPETEELRRPNEKNEWESSTDSATDANANCELATERQSINPAPSNNNNDITNTEDSLNLPSTSATTARTISCCSSAITAAATSSATSTPPVTINLDCINENGIISLDMSKIIDKTGLPTYDAALKLESSGYV